MSDFLDLLETDKEIGQNMSEDIIRLIFKHAPVESILRFRSVSRTWREMFDSTEFMQEHYETSLQNRSLMIVSDFHAASLLNSNEKVPLNLPYQTLNSLHLRSIVGCCYGVVCVVYDFENFIILWNPATKKHKKLPDSNVDFGSNHVVCYGFGYDDENENFHVVKVFMYGGIYIRVAAEVYTSRSGLWETIVPEFQFLLFGSRNRAIVDGNPYWLGLSKMDGSGGLISDAKLVVLWFDVKRMIFMKASAEEIGIDDSAANTSLVNWKGSLAAVVKSANAVKIGDAWADQVTARVWLFDGESWNLSYTYGPHVEMKMDNKVECSLHEKLVEYHKVSGRVLGFDPERDVCEELFQMDDHLEGFIVPVPKDFEVFTYTESLASIEGMIGNQ